MYLPRLSNHNRLLIHLITSILPKIHLENINILISIFDIKPMPLLTRLKITRHFQLIRFLRAPLEQHAPRTTTLEGWVCVKHM